MRRVTKSPSNRSIWTISSIGASRSVSSALTMLKENGRHLGVSPKSGTTCSPDSAMVTFTARLFAAIG
jgi:hypothetical protein